MMPKTITISDDVYAELSKIKGARSFSEILRELLKGKRGNRYVLVRLFGTMDKERHESLRRSLLEVEEEFEKWGRSLTRIS